MEKQDPELHEEATAEERRRTPPIGSGGVPTIKTIKAMVWWEIKEWYTALWRKLRTPKKYPDIENFLLGIVDLSVDEGIIVPLVEYSESYWYYIIRMKHPTREGMTISLEVPRHLDLIIDPEIWEHEFVEVTIRAILHKEFREDSGSSWGNRPGEIPIFKYDLSTGKHSVAHILSALFTVSAYKGKLIGPKEYAELLPWR